MSVRPILLSILAALAAAPASAGPLAPAERLDRLEREVGEAERTLGAIVPVQWGWGQQQSQPDDSGNRMNQLEGRMRQINGQVEQLQFQLRRIEDQLRRFQEDTEFRFNELNGASAGNANQRRPAPAPSRPQQRGDAAPAAAPVVADAGALPPAGPAPASASGRAGTGTPPQNLGQVQADPQTGQPLDLAAGARGPSGPPATGQVASVGGGIGGVPRQAVQPPSGSPRDAYDLAYGYFLRGDYDLAEEAFTTYLAGFPSDRQAGDALYWLGESHYQRRQWREAADAFLKSYTDFPQGAKAPDSLLRLGMSMRQLGQTQAACASFAEVLRRYPRASQAVRQRVAAEQRGATCAG